jgi:hypothetical protein
MEQTETRNYLIDLEKKLERSKMEQPIFILGEAPAVGDLLTYDQITVSKSVSMQSLGYLAFFHQSLGKDLLRIWRLLFGTAASSKLKNLSSINDQQLAIFLVEHQVYFVNMYNEAQHLKHRKKLLQKNVALIHYLRKLMNYKLLILTQKHSLPADLLDKAEWQMMISPAASGKNYQQMLSSWDTCDFPGKLGKYAARAEVERLFCLVTT